jgi:L-iditol 2-dehydrogenase
MKAAVLHKAMDVRIEERPEPKPGPHEVLIKVRAVGICGSDVHYYHKGGMGIHAVKEPIILGHECSGDVVAIGSGVEHFKVGQRIVTEPAVPCRHCKQCREGRYNLCAKVQCMGTPPVDGCLCEYIAWPQDFTFHIPPHMTYEEAALMEPLVVGIYSVDMSGLRVHQSVGILGAASVGLLTLAVAKRAGAGKTFIIDRIPERLEFAKKLGADEVVNFSECDPVKVVKEGTGGQGVDVVFEAAGSPVAVNQTIELVAPAGTIILIGICGEDVIPFNFGMLRRKEVTLKPIRRYRHVFPRAIEMAASGAINLNPFATHTYPLSGVVEAFELMRECRDGVVKAVVKPT